MEGVPMRAQSGVTRLLALVVLLAGLTTSPSAPAASVSDTGDQRIAALIDDGIRERREGNYRKSIETLNRALALARTNRLLEREISALGFLALSYRELHDLQKVLALRLESLRVVRANPQVFATNIQREESWQLAKLSGTYFLLKDLPNAIRFARAAVDVEVPHVTENDTVSIGRHRQQLGVLLFLAGEYKESERLLRLAYDNLETRVRSWSKSGHVPTDVYAMQLGVLRWLQRALVAQGRADEALEVAERSRARALAAITLSDTPGAPLTLDQMKAAARQQGTTIVAYTVAYEYDPDLLLEFSEFVDTRAAAILTWVIRPDGKSNFYQVDLSGFDKSLADMIADARSSIGARGRGGSRGAGALGARAHTPTTLYPALQSLHRILIAPIRNQLPASAASPVVFLPQDLLYGVPFAALQDEKGEFLVARHAPFVAQSVAMLAQESKQLRQPASSGMGVLVVGNPKMPSLPSKGKGPPVPLPQLPEAEKEALEIAAVFSANALVGGAATKERVIAHMPSARVVHFATHGLLDRNSAEYFNSLALAPAGDDPGFLTVREIDRMRLRAELVVLSACDSADGKVTGDSVLGFSSAFLAAGVPSVVVALWSIPDAPTALLMREFYSSMRQGRDKANALREAMLRTMKAHPHPANWAAFELIGHNSTSAGFNSIRGNSPMSESHAGMQGEPTLDILLPGKVTDYTQVPARSNDGPSARFSSPLSMAELVGFYRAAYAKKGLEEVRALTRLEPPTANLVMAGTGAHQLIVQITQIDDPTGRAKAERSVSVRFERKR
jgi:tetratricopeptide (TPR) repeat protein